MFNVQQETITVYEAIAEMRRLTEQGIPFSFTHATYNRPEQTGNGMRHVQNALLRPAGSKDDISHADIKLFYKDLDVIENANRTCWQPIIMYFNGKECKLT